jgi:hypothetical protein
MERNSTGLEPAQIVREGLLSQLRETATCSGEDRRKSAPEENTFFAKIAPISLDNGAKQPIMWRKVVESG